MASIIRIKRSGVTGSPPTLAQGEIAYSYLAGTQNNGGDRLYIGIGNETTPGVASTIVAIGGQYFTEMLDHVPGTLTANSAIITNSNSEIDTLKFGDITITGNTITTTLTNSNLVLNPAGTGSIDVSNATIINLGNPSANTDAVNKLYVDTEIASLGAASNLDITGNTGNTSIVLASEVFSILGGTGLSTDATSANNTLIITLNDTGVTANTYGSTTEIPVLTVNAQGQITAATTATISTSFNLYGDTGVQDISGGGSYTISGGDGSGGYIASDKGRWPANIIHDGSEEVLNLFPEAGNGWKKNYGEKDYKGKQYKGGTFGGGGYLGGSTYNDNGSAARFFYCAKASKKDRDEGLEGFEERERQTMGNGIGTQSYQQIQNNRNDHPTVKPTDLMQYLCRLVTPPKGTILDPFLGSGSTGKAAIYEGFNFIGFDLNSEYIDIATARIEFAIKNKNNTLFDNE